MGVTSLGNEGCYTHLNNIDLMRVGLGPELFEIGWVF